MITKELLEEARRRYPMGTKYRSEGDSYKNSDTIGEVIHPIREYGNGIEGGYGYIWHLDSKKWAEIIIETNDNYLILN